MPFDARREARLALAALEFLTRIPIPSGPERAADWLPRAAKYFPLVGLLVGALAGGAFLLARLVWPPSVAALLAVGGAVAVTGAFHEDGLADVADSFGGWTREARLAIMKDPRVGTFGALALVLCLGLRAAGLAALPDAAVFGALVSAHAGGRMAPVLVMATQTYAGRAELAKVAPSGTRPTGREFALAAVFGLAPLLLLDPARATFGLALGGAAAAIVAWRACRGLGGYTGDVLGAAEATFETAFLLGAAAAWSGGAA